MSNFDWKKAIGAVAPVLATLAGGPLAGTAVKVLGEVLLGNGEATEQQIADAVGSLSPEQIVAVRTADAEVKKKLIDAGIRLEELEAADRDSARKREIALRDPMTGFLAVAVVATWGLIQYQILTGVIPAEQRELVVRLLGTLDAALMAVLYYYFGSSRGSAKKDDALLIAAEKAVKSET